MFCLFAVHFSEVAGASS